LRAGTAISVGAPSDRSGLYTNVNVFVDASNAYEIGSPATRSGYGLTSAPSRLACSLPSGASRP